MGTASRLSGSTITVLLLDADAMLRRGVGELLEGEGIQIAGEARDAEEAIALSAELTPDLVLMGVRVKGVWAIEAARRICEATPECRVLILSNSTDPDDIAGALRAGACGYLLKDDPPEEIVAGVRAAAAGGSPLSPRVTARLLAQVLDGQRGDGARLQLTARERSVLELLAAGHANSQISEDLSISVSTVKRHISHLFEKLDVENRTQAAVVATRRDLL